MRNDDEEERHERKMIWLARGIIFLAVAWFFAMFACGLWLTGDCSALGWVVFCYVRPRLICAYLRTTRSYLSLSYRALAR